MCIPVRATALKTFSVSADAIIDKASFVKAFAAGGRDAALLLRPPHFGKTFFTRQLRMSFDADASPQQTAQDPLGVLSLDFSQISAATLAADLHQALRNGMADFFRRYPVAGSEALLAETQTSPATCFSRFVQLARKTSVRRIFVIIDDYDRFARDALQHDRSLFQACTTPAGVFQQFLARLKHFHDAGTVSHLFFTGVFNIGTGPLTVCDISRCPEFAAVCGFTAGDVKTLIQRRLDAGDPRSANGILQSLRSECPPYRFSTVPEAPAVFSPASVLRLLIPLEYRKSATEAGLKEHCSSNLLNTLLNLSPKGVTDQLYAATLGHPIDCISLPGLVQLNSHNAFNWPEALSALYGLGCLTFAANVASAAPQYVDPRQYLSTYCRGGV